ncbi:hypothetical protein QBC35DRAFT_463043 [Podospora australis]|uniref:Uncharacterized protein n=1 Tax=Podospora australis TaxID=1536484 RepID=A0AAN7AIU9_9PEZI|nr:hypothetical protein QBC35DRAFT_463043 [Podospora australis]
MAIFRRLFQAIFLTDRSYNIGQPVIAKLPRYGLWAFETLMILLYHLHFIVPGEEGSHSPGMPVPLFIRNYTILLETLIGRALAYLLLRTRGPLVAIMFLIIEMVGDVLYAMLVWNSWFTRRILYPSEDSWLQTMLSDISGQRAIFQIVLCVIRLALSIVMLDDPQISRECKEYFAMDENWWHIIQHVLGWREGVPLVQIQTPPTTPGRRRRPGRLPKPEDILADRTYTPPTQPTPATNDRILFGRSDNVWPRQPVYPTPTDRWVAHSLRQRR